MTTILNGLLGGLVVGAVAGIVVRLLDADSSATAALLDRATGTELSSSRWVLFGVRLVYGCLAGGALLALELSVLGMLGVPPTLGESLTVTLAWSALLLVTTASAWRVVSPSRSSRPLLELLLYHLVYGVGLGVWIRVTWIT